MTNATSDVSLVELAAARRLPRHQYMDAATIEWISAQRPAWEAADDPSPLPTTPQSLVRASAIPARWFAEPDLYDTIHGIRHSMRTAMLAGLLAEVNGLDADDTQTVIVAAAVHDCQRLHDQDDKGHGARAAVWLAANADTVWQHFELTAVPRQVIRAASAVRLHDIPYDAFAEGDLACHRRAERICDLVKAADALDRYRQPKLKWWPDGRYVREPYFEQLKPIAFDLVVISESAHLAGADSAEAVFYAFAEKELA